MLSPRFVINVDCSDLDEDRSQQVGKGDYSSDRACPHLDWCRSMQSLSAAWNRHGPKVVKGHQLGAGSQPVRSKDIKTDLSPCERMALPTYRPLDELVTIADQSPANGCYSLAHHSQVDKDVGVLAWTNGHAPPKPTVQGDHVGSNQRPWCWRVRIEARQLKPHLVISVPALWDINHGQVIGATYGRLAQHGYQDAQANRQLQRRAEPPSPDSKPMAATELLRRHWDYR